MPTPTVFPTYDWRFKKPEIRAALESLLGRETRMDFHIDGTNHAGIYNDGTNIHVYLRTSRQNHQFSVSKAGFISDLSSPHSPISVQDILETIKTKQLPNALDSLDQSAPCIGATELLLEKIRNGFCS